MYRIEVFVHIFICNHMIDRENIYSTTDYNDALRRFEFETDYQSRYATEAREDGSQRGFIYAIFYNNDGSILNRVDYDF